MKIKNYDDAKKQQTALKEKKDALLSDLQAVRKEFKITKDTDPATVSGKAGKAYKKAYDAFHNYKKDMETLNKYLAENKPSKEKKERVTKYEYPAGATADEKKKIRAAARAAAKKAEKEKNGGGKKKSKGKEEKSGGKKSKADKAKEVEKNSKKGAKKLKKKIKTGTNGETQVTETSTAAKED